MPPFSPAAKGLLLNSMNEFCPEKPCQPSLRTQGGSIRPVDKGVPVQIVAPVVGLIEHALGASLLAGPAAIEWGGESALLQKTPPGTRRAAGTGTFSKLFATLPRLAQPL